MAEEFIPINTQEEFDAAVEKAYGDVKGLQGQITTLTGERDGHAATIANLQKELGGYKTAELKGRIAKETGIPLDMASRLTGEDEKALREDAKSLAEQLRAHKGTAPLADPEPKNEEGNRAGLRAMLRRMKGD
jgi:hypothetical protein